VDPFHDRHTHFVIIRKSICVLIAPDLCLDHDRCSGDVEFYTISTSRDEERLGVGWVCEPCLDDLPQRGLDCPIIAKAFRVAFVLETFLNNVEEFQVLREDHDLPANCSVCRLSMLLGRAMVKACINLCSNLIPTMSISSVVPAASAAENRLRNPW